jgi:hypothetical protein
MATILDKSFRYTPAVETDVTRLFKRVDPQWNMPPSKRRNKKSSTRARNPMPRTAGTLIKIY